MSTNSELLVSEQEIRPPAFYSPSWENCQGPYLLHANHISFYTFFWKKKVTSKKNLTEIWYAGIYLFI